MSWGTCCGSFGPAGHMFTCTSSHGEAAAQQGDQCLQPAEHPARVRPQNNDVATQNNQSSEPNMAYLDVESLRSQMAASITKNFRSYHTNVIEEVNGALNDAIKLKVATIENRHQGQQATIERLHAQVAKQDEEIHKLRELVDRSHNELECVRCKGRELLTFQGLNTPQADDNSLRTALMHLSNSCDKLVDLLWQHDFADSIPPHVVDVKRAQQQRKQQLTKLGLRHAVWSELYVTVHIGFRLSQLVVGCGISSEVIDQEALILQLQLEKKRVDHWLQLTLADTSNSAADAATDQYTKTFITKLLGNQVMLDWDNTVTGSDPTMVLTPAARQLVAAAIKVQIIASAMHSQLIKVVVPGWLQDTGILASPAVPASWARSPGVVPFSRDWMQEGTTLPAAHPLPRGTAPAAVFCQEPAVVQLAARVDDLQEFGGQPQQSAYKVLVPARMAVARPCGSWHV